MPNAVNPIEDIELLETYLDGELDAAQAEALAQRLNADAELSAVLEELRTQRDVRQAVWQSLEPDDLSTERLNWRIRGAMVATQRRNTGWSQWQISRIGSAAAACIVLGFFGGWLGRGGQPAANSPAVNPGGENAVAVDSHTGAPIVKSVAPIMVPVTNEYGQVVAWQQFQNANDAKDFTEDLHRANHVPVSAPLADNNVKLMSTEEENANKN